MKISEDHAGTKRFGIKFGLVAVATAALVFGSVTPAFAADHYLNEGDFAGYEDGAEGTTGYNYDQWHIGNTNKTIDSPVSESLSFGECSVTTLENLPDGYIQVLKGYEPDERPTADDDVSLEELRALIDTISIDVAQGDVTLQLPLFRYGPLGPDDPVLPPDFTTLRNAETFGPGVHTLEGEDIFDSLLGVRLNASIDQLLDGLVGELSPNIHYLELLGVGFTGSADAEINSISFGGDTYYFGGTCNDGGSGDNGDGGDSDDPVTPTKPARIETGL